MNHELAYTPQYSQQHHYDQPPPLGSHPPAPSPMPGYPGAMQPQYLPIQQLPPGGYVPSYAMYHPGYGTPLPPPSSGLPPVTSSHGHARPPQMYQVLPSMNGPPPPSTPIDASGQSAPANSKPKVTATLWEDEGTLCFQVDANGICVARREDNNFVNGTKLLNVAGMTRGRRDGLLKSEKMRQVVKIGPMHLKGVWIPYDRALDMANRENITDLLYPLFVSDIGRLLRNNNNNGTNTPPDSFTGRPHSDGPGNSIPSVQNHLAQSPASAPGGGGHLGLLSDPYNTRFGRTQRPDLHRASTVPTPPASASGMPSVGSSDAQSMWGTSASSAQPPGSGALMMHSTLNHARTMPSTPATTPPANQIGGLAPRQIVPYPGSGPVQQPYTAPHGLPTYGQTVSTAGLARSDMGPPSARNAPANYAADAVAELKLSDSSHDGTAASAELNRVSAGNGYTQVPQLPGYDQLGAHTTFTHTSSSSGADPSYVSPGHTSAAPGQSSSGRSTPRSTNGQTSSQWSHKNGYTLSPSPHLQGETIRSESASGMPTNHTYSASNGGVPPKGMPSTYPSQLAGNKRRRDTSNDSVEAAQLARRKNVRENSTSSILNESFDDSNLSRPRSIIAALH